MENTQRVEGVSPVERTRGSAPSRAVPGDWFVDPAAPAAPASLEEQATAFLEAHEVEDDDALGTPSATVTALVPRSPAPRRGSRPRREAERPAESVPVQDWAPLPGLDLEPVEGELAWQVDALCAQTDPEAFFPEKGGSTRDAKSVCAECTVRRECLDYAMANDERFGIWGGLSERERARLRRARRAS